MCVVELVCTEDGESLPTVRQVSHLDASSSDGNRNGQKSGAETANGAFKMVALVTPVLHTLYLSFTLYSLQGFFFCLHKPYFLFTFHYIFIPSPPPLILISLFYIFILNSSPTKIISSCFPFSFATIFFVFS